MCKTLSIVPVLIEEMISFLLNKIKLYKSQQDKTGHRQLKFSGGRNFLRIETVPLELFGEKRSSRNNAGSLALTAGFLFPSLTHSVLVTSTWLPRRTEFLSPSLCQPTASFPIVRIHQRIHSFP